MATILFAWELGAGLGHVTRLRPLAARLVQRGHQVIVAARDTAIAKRVFHDTGILCVQAPYQTRRPDNAKSPASTFSHILHNVGFAHGDRLLSQVSCWQQLFDVVQPRLIVFDHSPTALLAARGSNARRIVFGDGFCCPPGVTPLPNLRCADGSTDVDMVRDESSTLGIINRVLRGQGQNRLECLADLYADVDDTLLTTFAELDHYGPRRDVRYWGALPHHPGITPSWPSGAGKRVFAYLTPHPSVELLCNLLRIAACPTIVYMRRVARKLRERHECKTLQFAMQPVDLRRAAAECDFAILNATHGTTVLMLLAGKPVLQLPSHLEQSLTARNTVRIAAGLTADRMKPNQVAAQFRRMMESNPYTDGAALFAARHKGIDLENSLDEMADHVEQLLPHQGRYDKRSDRQDLGHHHVRAAVCH